MCGVKGTQPTSERSMSALLVARMCKPWGRLSLIRTQLSWCRIQHTPDTPQLVCKIEPVPGQLCVYSGVEKPSSPSNWSLESHLHLACFVIGRLLPETLTTLLPGLNNYMIFFFSPNRLLSVWPGSQAVYGLGLPVFSGYDTPISQIAWQNKNGTFRRDCFWFSASGIPCICIFSTSVTFYHVSRETMEV